MIGAVDLGSNSLKHAIAERTPDGFVVVDEGERLVRVGEGLEQTGHLGEEAIERTLEGLREVRALFDKRGVTSKVAVATAGLRGANNPEAILGPAKAMGFDIEIIDGDREGQLAFAGPSELYGPERLAVFDIGGRSTEIIVGRAGDIETRVSLPLGGVLLTERFLTEDPPPDDMVAAMRDHIEDTLSTAPALDPETPLFGVAGTALALYGHAHDLAFMPDLIRRAEGRRLTVLQLTASLETLRRQKIEDRYLGDVIPPRRADVIVAGAALASTLLAHYRRLYFTLSARGVRHGLLQELVR